MSENREPLDLDELRRVAEAATPGSWSSMDNYATLTATITSDNGIEVALVTDLDEDGAQEDAAYIAAMDPPTTLALLAEVVALREQVARVREVGDRWYRQGLASASNYDVGGNHAAGQILAALDAAPKEPRP